MAASIRFLSRQEVCERTGLRPRTIRHLENRGEFPARRRIAARLIRYVESEVEDWLRTRPLATDVPADTENLAQYRDEG